MDICSAWCFDMVKLNFINLRQCMEQVPQQSLFFLTRPYLYKKQS